MKKAAGLLSAFLLGMGACMALFFFFSGRTPVLESGAQLPADMERRQYWIVGEQGGAAEDFVFVFHAGEDAPELTITLSDAMQFTLYMGDSCLYEYREDSPYSRNIVVPLGKPKAGENTLRIRMDAQEKSGELLFGPSSVVKLLLGSSDAARRAEMGYRQIFALIVGVYLALIYSSLVLFIRRHQEKYLFAFVVVSFMALAVMLVDNYAPLMISQRVYASIRSSLFICPVVFTAAIGFYLLQDAVPKCLRGFVSLRNLTLATLCTVVIQFFSTYNMNFALRFILLFLLLLLFCRAAERGLPGAYLLSVGYGLCEGARMFVYAVNTLQIVHPGELMIYLRLTQVGYLLQLILCMALVLNRFADKFTQAEQLVHTLDDQVAMRTSQLKEANRQLKVAWDREHEVMTNVLHDLRTPIFHLQGYMDMLLDGGCEEPQILAGMQERIGYVRSLAENLFLAAKLEDRQISFHSHDVNLTAICRYVLDAAMIAAKGKGLEVAAALEEDAHVIGDGFRIRQILENLVDNAVKYTPEGGYVRLELCSEGKTRRLTVTNSGDGIAQEDLPHVFDRFYHGSASGSSGLGLYIAKTLVDCMGGRLEARSSNGVTAFTLTLAEKETEETQDETGIAH